MEMQTLPADQATAFLDSASYVEPTMSLGEKAIHIGIDAIGREFILIASALSDAVPCFKLGFY